MSHIPRRGRGRGTRIARDIPEGDDHREGRVHGRWVTASARRDRFEEDVVPPQLYSPHTPAGPSYHMEGSAMPFEGPSSYRAPFEGPSSSRPPYEGPSSSRPPLPYRPSSSARHGVGSTPAAYFRSPVEEVPYDADEGDYEDDEAEIPAGVDSSGDDSWLLKESAPGGPLIPNVIPSFGGHVAADIWRGAPERGLLAIQSRTKALERWGGPSDRDSLLLLQGCGVRHLRGCMLLRYNTPLICAFVERWQPDTNTFHMPFGEMTITLHDVHYILGIPIEGRPVSSCADRAELISACSEIFHMDTSELDAMWGKGPLLSDIQARCCDESGSPPHHRAMGYLIYLLGCTLFVDKSRNRVRPSFCTLLQDITAVGAYSWGAATLAYLYRQLGVASRADASGIAGCLTLLEVNWLPYGPDPAEFVPKTLFHGTIRFMDVIEPYMPNRVLRQFGYRQTVPAAPIAPIERPKRSRRPKEYKVKYGAQDMEWQTPAAHQLQVPYYGTRAIPASEAEGRYATWYTYISHIQIHNPEVLPGAADRPAAPIPPPQPFPAMFEITKYLYPVLPRSQPQPSYEELHQAVLNCGDHVSAFIDYLGLEDAPEPDERGSRRGGPQGSHADERGSRRSRR